MKTAGIVILCFLLFISLCVFGLSFTVNSTILNPRFIPAEINKLDISTLVDEALDQYAISGISTDMRSSIIATIDELEPEVKVQLGQALSQVYDYLLGREQSIDLAQILKDTVLSSNFVNSVISKTEVKKLIREQIRDELVDLVPPGNQELIRYLDEALPVIDPWLEEQISVVSSPITDFLLGKSTNINITLSLEPVKNTLKDNIRKAFLRSPPPELADVSQAELNIIFDEYYQQYSTQVPKTITINQTSIGINSNELLVDTIAGVEDFLTHAKTVTGYFRTYYVVLIIFIIILVLGIILLHREVKGVTRTLGIILLTYGGLEYISIFAGKYIIRNALPLVELPSTLQSWIPVLLTDALRPLEVLSLVLGVVGIALIIVSIVYRRRSSQVIAIRSDQQP